MLELAEFIHYFVIAMVCAVTAISVGIGQGLVGASAVQALDIQPKAKDDIQKIALLGTALIETSAIIGLTIAIILLLGSQDSGVSTLPALPGSPGSPDLPGLPNPSGQNIYISISELAIGLVISVTGLLIGFISSIPAKNACLAVARQPFFGAKILKFMLITQSMIETPIIFSFIIAMFIKNLSAGITTLEPALKFLAAGFAMAIGGIGPALGLGKLAKTAFQSVGINRKSYSKVFTFMLVNGAMIETPTIFALLVSMLIIGAGDLTLLKSISLLSAAVCIGLGTFGPGLSTGRIASAACEQIGKNPDSYSLISKTSIFAQSITETAAIYALMVSLLIILT